MPSLSRITLRRRLFGVAVAGFGATICAFLACSSPPLRTARTAAPGTPTLSVMTYNLNYGLSGDEETLRAITDNPTDLVFLQETTPAWEAAIVARLADRYPHRSFHFCCGAGGLGLLSVYPLDEAEYLEPPAKGWFPAQRLRVHTPLGPVQLLNVHLRPQIGASGPNLAGLLSGAITTPPIRREEIESYLTHLQAGVATLIGGDFNESEDGGVFDRLARRGYRSVLPEFSNDDTWRWDLGSAGRVERRFDHLVCDRALEVLSARVVAGGRSDHLPVVAVFAPNRGGS